LSNDLLIKISADAANAKKAFDDIKGQTEDLENQLKTVALVSAAAFAAFTAEIYLAESAFREAQKSAIQLTNALQNQGIYTKELEQSYRDYAAVVQEQTGIDNDAVISAQAVAQTYLGQTKITQELTSAIADLGAFMDGDLNGAAEKIARTIGTGTNAFARQGLVISETATESERYAKVLEFVQAKAGGLAADMAQADGNVNRLKTAFGNAQEAIGERFAPVLSAVRGIIAKFFEAFDKYPVLADVAAALITAGTVVTGLIAALALGVPAFTTLTAAVAAFGVSVNIAFVGIPLLIGAVVASLTFLALNWGKTVDFLKATLTGFMVFAQEAFGGLRKIISGAISLDPSAINAGVEQLKNSLSRAKEVAVAYYQQAEQIRNYDASQQDAQKKAQADKEANAERQHQANLRNIKLQENALLKLQNENASEELIALKQKEIETLKALDAESNENTRALLADRLVIIREHEAEKQLEEIERRKVFAQALEETKAELAAQGLDSEIQIEDARLAMLQSKAQTEVEIEKQLQEDILKKRIDASNRRLLDAKKYGESYAAINKVLQSDEVQGAKSAADELVKLQSSKSQELKAIGKAAALAQIAIGTAESAMNIYRGFSTIPIVGPALGIAGALAAVAFGGERAGDVIRAADGGLIEGGVAGRDSVPALLMPGELVVPKRNFNDVVNAVQGQNTGGTSNVEILEALRGIAEKIGTVGNNYFYGDLSTDEAFVDNFVKKISDAIEYRNARIYGVTP
jgi:hypothetical protein